MWKIDANCIHCAVVLISSTLIVAGLAAVGVGVVIRIVFSVVVALAVVGVGVPVLVAILTAVVAT
jgi:hypothetical protein